MIPSFVIAPTTINVTTMARRFCNGPASARCIKLAKPRSVRNPRRVVAFHTRGRPVALPASTEIQCGVIRIVLALSILAGCGRLGFDSTGDGGGGSTGDGKGSSGSATIDAPISMVCGDGVCGGNTGESCQSCTADCQTTAPVCGNYACDPGEDGASCPGDCGPTPWPWTSDEAELRSLVNAKRTGGVTCPGTTTVSTAPALADDMNLDRAARDIVWEEAEHGTIGVRRCDGQSVLLYLAQVGASNSQVNSNTNTNQQRVDAWAADMNGCPNLMDAAKTTMGVAIATGAISTTYAVMFH